MAHAASEYLGKKIRKGIVITKYNHSQGYIKNFDIFEAGHPMVDENSLNATREVIKLVSNLESNDTVIFLVSGGGSSLFALPLHEISLTDLQHINNQLLSKGASIEEINTIRKRLSKVKGGKFANICMPAEVLSIVLSDIVNDPVDMIASGPAAFDLSTNEEALYVIDKYKLDISEEMIGLIRNHEKPQIDNVELHINGSVAELCNSAFKTATNLGYRAVILTTSLETEARSAGEFLGEIAKYHHDVEMDTAFIVGGETVVTLKGDGLGGRNQELSLASAKSIQGLNNVCIFSVGSDGTDGPTDAAGGYVDGDTYRRVLNSNLDYNNELNNNNSYNVLKAVDGLIVTGPTGTNVNDLTVILIKSSIDANN